MVRRPKEVHFFDRQHERGLEWYAAQFEPRPKHRHWGEATPNYLYLADARERMAAALPDARFVAILREPVSRAYSHYWHSRRLGVEPLETFEAAVAAEPARLATGDRAELNRHSYLARGRYLDQLRPLAEAVGRDRLHVLLFEDLLRDRVPTVAAVFGFLGVDPAPAAKIPSQHVNPYRVRRGAGSVQTAKYPPLSAETRTRLAEELADANAGLASWLGRDLTAWEQRPRVDGPG
jgi:hypothetical protein